MKPVYQATSTGGYGFRVSTEIEQISTMTHGVCKSLPAFQMSALTEGFVLMVVLRMSFLSQLYRWHDLK